LARDESAADGDGAYRAEKVIDFESREHDDWDMPVPALPTDILISMDDRYLFGSNWLHGEVWMYDISDPSNPRRADSLGRSAPSARSRRSRAANWPPARR